MKRVTRMTLKFKIHKMSHFISVIVIMEICKVAKMQIISVECNHPTPSPDKYHQKGYYQECLKYLSYLVKGLLYIYIQLHR